MNRLLTLTQTFLTGLWKFFQLPFPGTNVSIGAIVIFPVVVSITVAFIRSLFGVGGFAQLSRSASDFSYTGTVHRALQRGKENRSRAVVQAYRSRSR